MNRCIIGSCLDVLPTLPEKSIQMCVTSPPYWGLRDYGVDGQLGLEPTPEEYVARMVEVFREVRRVLADDGTLWLNLGDSYAAGGMGAAPSGKNTLSRHGANGRSPYLDALGSSAPRSAPPGLKPKDLVGIPWMVAFALRADGWYLRSDIIWHKPNPMPESVTDRPTKSHEYLFLLSKSERYFYDGDAISEASIYAGDVKKGLGSSKDFDAKMQATVPRGERLVKPTRNRRTVWTIPTEPYSGSHFATFPRALVTPCIMAGSRLGDTVLDPFFGSGTVGQVAESLGRKWVGIELNPKYGELAAARTAQAGLAFKGAA